MEINRNDEVDAGRPPSVSAACLPGATVKEIVDVRNINHGRVRQTTVGALRSAGYSVTASGEVGHVDIGLGGSMDRGKLEMLEAIFGPAQLNPRRAAS